MKQFITKMFLGISVGIAGFLGIAMVAWLPQVATATDPVGSFTDSQKTSWLNVPWSDLKASDSLLQTVRKAINWILGILGMIALIILLVGGFQMVTAAGDENKYKKGFTILKQAGIGLLFIWLAALFVNMIMWFIKTITS